MEEEDEDFNMDDVEVEQASSDDNPDSPDEDFEQVRQHTTRGARKRKRALDDESDDDKTPFNMNDAFDPLTMDLPDESEEHDE